MTRRGKKRLLILVAVAGVLAVAAGAAYVVREARHAQQLSEAYRDGMDAYDAGDYEGALRGLGKSLSEHRDDAEVLYRVADSRQRLPLGNDRHIAAAIPYAREASTRSPSDKRPLELLIDLYRKSGFITERLEAANRLLALDPHHHAAHLAKIECLSALGRSEEMRKAIGDLIDAYPADSFAHASRVEMMRLDAKPSSEILAYVDSLVKQWPGDVALATLQIRTLAAFGNRDDAVVAAKRAVELEIPNTELLLELVRTLDLLGLRSNSDELLARAVSDERFREDVFAYLIERAWKTGQADRAREQVREHAESIPTAPSNLLGWMALASLSADGSWKNSEPGRVLADRTDDDAHYWQVMLKSRELINAQKLSAARESLNDARMMREDASLVWSSLGEVFQQLGETDTAVSSFRQAVSLDPTYSRAQMMLAASLIDQGRLDDARFAAERAVMSNPAAPEALTLARVYIALIDADRGDSQIENGAVSILEELSAQAPDQPDVQGLLARTYVAVGHVQDAQEVINRLSQSDRIPAPAVLIDLIRACRQKAPALVAPLMEMSERSRDDSPEMVALRLTRGAVDVAPEQARAAYQSAIEDAADPIDRMRCEIAYAQFLDVIGDDKAFEELKRVAEAYPDRAEAQQALLDSRAAWTDQNVISAAIGRLKAITGEQASRWRLADAQRALAFEPGDATASEVILNLTPLAQPPISNVKAMMLTSDAMLMLNDRPGAVRVLSRAIELQSDNPLLYSQAIDLLQSTGRTSEASQQLRAFLKLKALNPVLQRRRIELLARQRMWPEAIADCEDLVTTTEDPRDQLRLAILYGGHGRPVEARRLFEQLLAAPSADRDTRVAAANFYAAAGEFESGLAVLKPLQSELNASEYAATLGSYYERHGQVDDAARVYREQAETSANADDWAKLVEFQVRNRRLEQARLSIDRGLAISANHPSLLALRSVLDALESGQLNADSVQGILNTLVDESIRPAMSRLAEAMQYYEANPNDFNGYIQRLRTAVDRDPGLILGWQLLAGALLGNSRNDEAVEAAQSAVRILPNSVRAAELLASTLFAARRFDEARIAARRWNELDTELLSRSELLLAQIESATNNPTAALTAIEPWIQRIQDEAEEYPTRLGFYASILVKAGRIDEAHNLIWPRARQSADWAKIYIQLASEMSTAIETAIQWVDRATPLIPLDVESRAALAQVRVGLGRQSSRLDQIELAVNLIEPIRTDPKTPGAVLGMLASCYQQLGQLEKAETAYRSALQLTPGDPIVLNNLAYLLLRSDGKGEEALRLAEQAIAGAQQRRFPPTIRANLLDTVGSAQLRLSMIAEARETFGRGLSLDPNSAMLRLGLAEALAKSGRVEDARSEYRRVTARGDLNRGDADLASRLEQVSQLLN